MGTLPLKIKISKIELCHVLSWPKLGLEAKCHAPGTSENDNTETHKIHVLYVLIFLQGALKHNNTWKPESKSCTGTDITFAQVHVLQTSSFTI